MNKLLTALLLLLSVNGYSCVVTLHANLTTNSFLLGKVTLKKLTRTIKIDDVGTEQECEQRAKSYRKKLIPFTTWEKINGSRNLTTVSLPVEKVTASY